MKKFITKNLILVFTTFSLFFCNFSLHVFAEEILEKKSEKEDYACPVPRNTGTEKEEEFIQFIEKEKNISRNDENVFIQYNGNNTVSVSILNSDGTVTVYTTPTEDEYETILNYNENSKGLLWEALVWLYNAYEFGQTIKEGCEKIDDIFDVDVCTYVSREVIKNLVETGTKKKCLVSRYLEKKTCPYPPNSLQCNQPPFAYWKTVVKPY